MSSGDFSLVLIGVLIGTGVCLLAAGAGAVLAHFMFRAGK